MYYLFSWYSLSDLDGIINQEFVKVVACLKINKSFLNFNKTNFILFHTSQKKITSDIIIKINNASIEQFKFTKFLGVIINENLTWSNHIQVLLSKTSKSLGIIHCLLVFSYNYIIFLFICI